ncbi:MAG: hypothetical protein NT007_02745 [Candidatus Kapabacteria bacterium]|nr:hypothetical protein [Candidatus Kapabacteria bacterium]
MQTLTLSNNEIPLKALRGLMKEVAMEAKEKAFIADQILNERIREELSNLINRRNAC